MRFLTVEVKETMHKHVEFKVVHVQREAYKVAHVLANHALTSSVMYTWFVTAPRNHKGCQSKQILSKKKNIIY